MWRLLPGWLIRQQHGLAEERASTWWEVPSHLESELKDLHDHRTYRYSERKFPLFDCLQEKLTACLGLQFPASHLNWVPSIRARLWRHFPSVVIVQLTEPHEPWMQPTWAPESGPKTESRATGFSPGLKFPVWPRPSDPSPPRVIWSLNTQATGPNVDQLPHPTPPLDLELSCKPQNPPLIHGPHLASGLTPVTPAPGSAPFTPTGSLRGTQSSWIAAA